jgi:hypothetical protein
LLYEPQKSAPPLPAGCQLTAAPAAAPVPIAFLPATVYVTGPAATAVATHVGPVLEQPVQM